MPLNLPPIEAPLTAVAACLNRILLTEHPELTGLIPKSRTVETAVVGDRFVRMTREKFENNEFSHIHIEIGIADKQVDREHVVPIDAIVKNFDLLRDRSLLVRFESRFRVEPSDLPPISPIVMLSNVGMKLNNTNAALSGASIALADPVVQEIRWRKFVDTASKKQFYVIEVVGDLGDFPITSDLLMNVSRRAGESLAKFVMPQMPNKPPPQEGQR